MKRMLFPLAFSLLVVSASAQKGKDYITKKQDGHMYWMRGGQSIKLAIPVPLKDGSTAYPNGSVQTKDGDLTTLAEGDKVLMDGTRVAKGQAKQRHGR